MATRNVVLTSHQEQVIQDLVQSGRYQNASEVMREGLRLLEQRIAEDTAKIEALRQAISITGHEQRESGALLFLSLSVFAASRLGGHLHVCHRSMSEELNADYFAPATYFSRNTYNTKHRLNRQKDLTPYREPVMRGLFVVRHSSCQARHFSNGVDEHACKVIPVFSALFKFNGLRRDDTNLPVHFLSTR